jgi:hypothetical protein
MDFIGILFLKSRKLAYKKKVFAAYINTINETKENNCHCR